MKRVDYEDVLQMVVNDLEKLANYKTYAPISYLPAPLVVDVLAGKWGLFMEEIEDYGFVVSEVLYDKEQERPKWIFQISESTSSTSEESESE